MKKVLVGDDRIILLDNSRKRVAEILINDNKIYCQLCKKANCIHVGYAFAMPEIYDVLVARNVQPPE